jgi:hypothetical protein
MVTCSNGAGQIAAGTTVVVAGPSTGGGGGKSGGGGALGTGEIGAFAALLALRRRRRGTGSR